MANNNKSKSGQKMVGVDTTIVRPKVSPPAELSKEAKKYWRKIVNSVPNDQFTISDFAILGAYCENYAIMIKAEKNLAEQGEVLEDDNGKLYKNPWFVVLQEVSGKIATIATKVRLCPSARQKAESTKEKPPPGKTTSRLGSLING